MDTEDFDEIIDLEGFVRSHPAALKSYMSLRTSLRASFPSEPRQVRLALAAYDCGIEREIREAEGPTFNQALAWAKKLEEGYGLRKETAVEAVCLWLEAYGYRTDPLRPFAEKPPEICTTKTAATRDEGFYLMYDLYDDGATVTGYKGHAYETLVIPQMMDGHPVRKIGRRAFYGCKDIVKVTLPEGVTEIQSEAFACCRSLTEAVLPWSLKKISSRAFSFTGLESVTLPPVLRELGDGAFEECRHLETAHLPDSLKKLGGYAFFNTAIGTADIPPGVKSVGAYAFGHCHWLADVSLPEGLEQLGDFSFLGCVCLEEVALPSSLRSIGMGAFDSCFSLADAPLPPALESLGASAFAGCPIADAYLPDSLRFLGESAFDGCKRLASVRVPEGIRIPPNTFRDCVSLRSVDPPGALENADGTAFEGCTLLKDKEPLQQ